MKSKIYILTYQREKVLFDTIRKVLNSTDIGNTEINVINNYGKLNLPEEFSKVNIINNETRPDWSNGNMAENWNQAIIHGFKDLNNPDCDNVITLQNDAAIHKDWYKTITELHKKYEFIVGQFGDNVVSYTPNHIKKVGIWDERFCGLPHKESDYWLRSIIHNKELSTINDKQAKRTYNLTKEAEKLDVNTKNRDRDWRRIKTQSQGRRTHNNKKTTGNYYISAYIIKYYKWKWNLDVDPTKFMISNWDSETFKNLNPKKEIIKYPYFEKDINQELYEIKL